MNLYGFEMVPNICYPLYFVFRLPQISANSKKFKLYQCYVDIFMCVNNSPEFRDEYGCISINLNLSFCDHLFCHMVN